MNINWQAGDLAFIPADVTIVKVGKHGTVKKSQKTIKPKNVLILKLSADIEIGEDYYEVLYNGENWYVKDTDIYGEKNVNCSINRS